MSLKKLKARHRMIARMLISGNTVTEIADELGMTVAGIRHIAQSPLFIQLYGSLTNQLDDLCLDFADKIERGRLKALDRIIETLEPESEITPALQSKNAFDLLNRSEKGYKMPDTVVAQSLNVSAEKVSPEVMEILGRVLNAESEVGGEEE